MRVSSYEQYGKTINYVSTLQNQMQKEMGEISTGKAFNQISDDPVAANQSMIIDQAHNQIEQYQKNISNAQDFLNTNDTVLSNVEDIMNQVKGIAQQASSATYDSSSMTTFAKQLEQNIQQLVTLGNTQQMGKYIYAGQMTTTQPFSYDGTTLTYNGDSSQTNIPVSSSSQVTALDPGNQVLEGVINSVIDLKNQVQSLNQTNVANTLTNLNNQFDNIVNQRSEVGTRLSGVQSLSNMYDSVKLNLETRQENIEGTDLTKVISELQSTQQLYQGSLQASVKIMNTSILNYI